MADDEATSENPDTDVKSEAEVKPDPDKKSVAISDVVTVKTEDSSRAGTDTKSESVGASVSRAGTSSGMTTSRDMSNLSTITCRGLAKKARLRRKYDPCKGRTVLKCEDDPLWKTYMKLLAEGVLFREREESEKYGNFPRKRMRPPYYPRLPCLAQSPILPPDYELNAFNLKRCWSGGAQAMTMWQCMRQEEEDLPGDDITRRSSDFEWPRLYPCSTRDPVKERKVEARKNKLKKIGALPCELEAIESPESSEDEQFQELAKLKELGHARIPITAPLGDQTIRIDRDCGPRPGLVEGEFVIYEFTCKKGNRRLANLTLQGLDGMHLNELERTRTKTWKFCVYQAIVALLVKTQLRYRFAWSANIDYIYQHAWLLFLHIGYLNIQKNQRFDDILVYNYKYSIELQLVHELKNVPVVEGATFKFIERTFVKLKQPHRQELTIRKATFGDQKCKDQFNQPVHKGTKIIEKWFDKLDIQYTNCIFRVSKFSLAFWQDGPFWYVYNPYRCDKYGFWDDTGSACITKFCSKIALRRHLMVLVLRAYAYKSVKLTEEQKKQKKEKEKEERQKEEERRKLEEKKGKRIPPPPSEEEEELFTIQIFQMIYHTCNIHNVKLYLRSPRKPKIQYVEKKKSDTCAFDPLADLSPKTCEETIKAREKEKLEELKEKMERPYWLTQMKIRWSKIPQKKSCKEEDKEVIMWHNFTVIDPRHLFVLWGKIHITDKIFVQEHRSRQFNTCYAVCAGMSLINAPEYWTSDSLDAIVVCGDKFFGQRIQRLECLPKQLPNSEAAIECDDDWDSRPCDRFRIGDNLFDVLALPCIKGRLFSRDAECLWRSLEQFFQRHRFGVLACESARVGIFKQCGAYYINDVRSYGHPIYEQGYGASYLLRSSCFLDFISSLILIIGSCECSIFTVRPLEIVGILDIDDPQCPRKKLCLENKNKCANGQKKMKAICPLEDERKKARKKRKRSLMEEDKKTTDKIICTAKD